MKVLFLTHHYPNYVPDLLLHGFRKLIGENAVEYPMKESLYKGQFTGIASDNELCPELFNIPADKFDRENIEDKINNDYFDFVFADIRTISALAVMKIKFPKRLIIIDGEDYPVFNIAPGNFVVLRRETNGFDFSIPLPMALPEEILNQIKIYDNIEKKYKVGFLGSVDSKYDERKKWIETITERFGSCLFSVTSVPTSDNPTPTGRFGKKEYYEKLQSCDVVLNFRGAGFDTFRYWENAACRSVQISQNIPILIPNNFTHRRSIMFFSGIDDMLKNIEEILDNKNMKNEIIKNSREELIRYHTTEKRAVYVLDRLKILYGI